MNPVIVLEIVVVALVPVGAYALMWFLVFAPGPYRTAALGVITVPFWIVKRWLPRRRGRLAPAAPTSDPFAALGVQFALGRLTAELEALSTQDQVFGRGFRLAATKAAYDDVLAEACVLSEVRLQRSRNSDPEVVRIMAETALADRGWTW